MSASFSEAMAQLRACATIQMTAAAPQPASDRQPTATGLPAGPWMIAQHPITGFLVGDAQGSTIGWVSRGERVIRFAPEMHQVCVALATLGPDAMLQLVALGGTPPVGLALAIDVATKVVREAGQ